MPRHPPYTLSSLTTFIDHRHDPPQEQLALGESPAGEPETVQTIDNGPFRQKGARRLLPDRKTKMGRQSQRYHASSVTMMRLPLNLVIHLSKSKPSSSRSGR